MSVSPDHLGPYPFTEADLRHDRLVHGVRHTLADYTRWRDGNPGAIAAHVDRYTEQLARMAASRRRLPRWLTPGRRRRDRRAQAAREATYFAVYDLAEVPAADDVDRLVQRAERELGRWQDLAREVERARDVAGVLSVLTARVPGLDRVPQPGWLAGRLERLHRILPEAVVRAGGMGKVVRTIAGVLAIGAYDVRSTEPATRREHLARILPGAYAYGAAYAIVDDTLHDLPGYLSPADRDHYHAMIASGLATGAPLDPAGLPDHPLADELLDLYDQLLTVYPFQAHRPLWHAAESMYLAQHRDAATAADRLAELYPDVFVKAGMSRVIANLLGRRSVPDGFYARCLNTIFLSQFKDDLADRAEDRAAGRVTPFTLDPALARDALHDLFGYDAYVCDQVYGGDETAREAFTWFGAVKLAVAVNAAPSGAARLPRDYHATAEMERFLRRAAGLGAVAARELDPADMRLKHTVGRSLRHRPQTTVDARTFVADRRAYLDDVVRAATPGGGGELDEIIAYALDGAGKRLRPALTLMLAESLGVPYPRIEPLLGAIELFHTASLVFDDLPAQDDATTRRGRPTVHLAHGEAGAQLAAIAMLSSGFGLLATLDRHHPPARVTAVIEYVGTVLGPRRLCQGQLLDLRLDRDAATEDILRMYRLKTSAMLEAALVPLMLLEGRPVAQTDALRRYADHAGTVFQLRDDLLDLTAAEAALGKDTGHDTGKANAVRTLGPDAARQLLAEHLAAAHTALAELSFDTALLAGVAEHFAHRRR
ncbi:polyprenyl synthetase family protein [Catellatospora tritici]|uniref:polyprenyl synthetase family protein n=1 Tax=Catellatospora tritici TaxID=2851566 RepID=UPI001C2DD987|nr:polyprenyl synthetase family protein [Catellatospora tritici]MBV1854507.1 polyprenyl synthetase family protein [Catellatospora tritici]